MTQAGSIEDDWDAVVAQAGGAELLEREARQSGAFQRPREVGCAVDLLRLILAYCLGGQGLRMTAAWAETIGLARLSNVALLGRLRLAAPWLERILVRLLAASTGTPEAAPSPAGGQSRLIRLVDATNVRKAGKTARESGQVWRVHAVFDLPGERFSAFEITDEKGAERLDRAAVLAGEIRIADRVHCQPDQIAAVLAAGADVVVRAGWSAVRWLEEDGSKFDLIGLLAANTSGLVDQPVWLARGKGKTALRLRLVAARLPPGAAVKAAAEARKTAARNQNTVRPETLAAAEWMILVTSLDETEYDATKVCELYRLRWRIEIAFKRLKSLGELAGPPGTCPKTAKAWILSHLIISLLTEARIGAVGTSPRRATAPAPTSGGCIVC